MILRRQRARRGARAVAAYCTGRGSAQAARGAGGLGEEYDRRLSFCCALDVCRKRTTPPSLRFLGRKVYLGAVVVLICGDAAGRDADAHALLTELIGVEPPDH